MYELITKANLRCPQFVGDKAKDLLEKLIVRKPEDRLGAGPEDEMAIRKHPFFDEIDFDKLLRKEVDAEFKPRLQGHLDASNFDTEFTSEKVVDSVVVTTPRDPNTPVTDEEFTGFAVVNHDEDDD